MRMLLIQPRQGTQFGFTRILTAEPLGLECVGGAVRARGYDAELVDLRIDDWAVLDRALDDAPAAAGISCAFTTDVEPSIAIAGFIKERLPELPVIVGGHHASLVPGDFLSSDTGVDAVVVGEGEGTSAELMDALRRREAIGAVPGVLTRTNRDAFRPRPFTREMDELAGPDRSLTARYRRWYHHGPNPRSASLETSRGCPFDCNFCSVWVFYNRRAGRKSPAAIVRELETIGEETVFITDDIAFLNHDAYREMGERIKAAGIWKRFSCETRSDLVIRHRDILEKWRDVGLNTIFLGVEKIDDEGLAAIRKRTKGGAGTNVEAIRTLRDVGITPMTIFITDAAWGEDDFERLEEFLDGLGLPHCAFTILTPLPGTEIYTQRRHELTTDDYAYYDLMHTVLPTRLPQERFYERFARLFDHTVEHIRPTLPMLGRAAKLALQGDLWCVKKVYQAVKQMRDPKAYLEPPVRVRAPRRASPREARQIA
jgi:hopanoid C-3 methylase